MSVSTALVKMVSTIALSGSRNHGHARATERELMAAALGLAQGWAWSGLVDTMLNALLSLLDEDDFFLHALVGVTTSCLLTTVLLGVRVGLGQLRTVVVRQRWQDASVRTMAVEFAAKAPLSRKPSPSLRASPKCLN